MSTRRKTRSMSRTAQATTAALRRSPSASLAESLNSSSSSSSNAQAQSASPTTTSLITLTFNESDVLLLTPLRAEHRHRFVSSHASLPALNVYPTVSSPMPAHPTEPRPTTSTAATSAAVTAASAIIWRVVQVILVASIAVGMALMVGSALMTMTSSSSDGNSASFLTVNVLYLDENKCHLALVASFLLLVNALSIVSLHYDNEWQRRRHARRDARRSVSWPRRCWLLALNWLGGWMSEWPMRKWVLEEQPASDDDYEQSRVAYRTARTLTTMFSFTWYFFYTSLCSYFQRIELNWIERMIIWLYYILYQNTCLFCHVCDYKYMYI